MGSLLVLFLLAEAGHPSFSVCTEATCPCDGDMCACGQVCKFSGQPQRTCGSSTTRFCKTNADCALTCGSFVCEFNQCITGTLADGGPNVPVPASMPVEPVLPPTVPEQRKSPGCGGASLAIVAFLPFFRRLTIRRS